MYCLDILMSVVFNRPNFFCFAIGSSHIWLKERNVNKKRETIRKPVDREAAPEWDDQDRLVPPKQAKSGKRRSEEEDMILDKDND